MDSLSLENQQKVFQNWLGNYHCKQNHPWRIGNTLNGRGLIATRDIGVNELVLCEPPLIVGLVGNENDDVLCVACLKFISKSEICFNCGLSVCYKCPKIENHFDECSFLSSFISSKNNKNSLKVLTSIRGTLMNDDQKEILNLLQANCTKDDERLIDDVFKDIHIENNGLRDELISVASILNTNAFQIVAKSTDHTKNLRGLYPLMSLINHRCTANARYSTDENYTTNVFARKQIKIGDEISISYSKILWSTPARQSYLKITKQFTCVCDRCLDATENSTFLSALKCFDRSCSGLVLSVDPTNFASLWECLICKRCSTYQTILRFQEVVSCMVNGWKDIKSVKEIEDVFNNRLLKVLPVSNQFVVEMKTKVISMMGKDQSTDEYKLIERYCMDILSLLEKLDAGECILKGVIEFKLFKCRQQISMDDTGKCSMTEFESIQQKLLANAWSILKDNISAPVDLAEEVKKYSLPLVKPLAVHITSRASFGAVST